MKVLRSHHNYRTNHVLLARPAVAGSTRASVLAAAAAVLAPLGVATPALAFDGAVADPPTESIRLTNGDVLVGRIIEFNDTTVRFSHDLFGDIELDRVDVTLLGADEATGAGRDRSNDVALAVMQDDAEAAADDAAETEKVWSFRFVAAASYTTGNSESTNISGLFTGTRETEDMRTIIDAAYFYAESDGEESDNKFTTGILNDWLFPDSPWFVFASARFDNDEFESWDQRFTAHVGPGYQFIDDEDFNLRGRLGIGVIREWGSSNEDWRPEGLIGVEGRWQITERQELRFDSTAFPDLDDAGEFRVVSNAAWSLLVDEEMNLSLTVGARHEYQSQVDPGDDKNNLRIFAGLQIDI